MSTFIMVWGAFALGVGLERGYLPGVGMPYWIWLVMGSMALVIGILLRGIESRLL